MGVKLLFALPVAIAIGIAGVAATSPTEAIDPGGHILVNLKAAAERGDRRAQAALDDLESYAAAHGLDLARLTSKEVAEGRTAGRVTLRAQGIAPFWIDVYQQVAFDQAYTVQSYVAERRVASLMLSGGARHRGRLSVDGYAPLARLCAVRDAVRASIGDADIDVWYGAKWVSRMGVGPDRADFWGQGCSAIESQLRDLLAEAHADEPLAALVDELRLTVHSATADVAGDSVAALLAEPDVLLFDPQDDLLAPWRGRAAHVRLVAQVDAFTELIQARVAAGEIADPFVPVDLGIRKEAQP